MERRPFTLKERPFRQRLARALLFIVAWMVIGPLMVITLGPHIPVWTTLLLVFGFFVLLIILHIRSDMAWPDLPTLIASPCPQCGASPMKFDRGTIGDYVFTCEKCQIEWTFPNSTTRDQ
jgi:hypothetical protein